MGKLSWGSCHVKAFAAQWGYADYETDWKKLLERDDIDAVDICTPNNFHAEIALAAIKAGKMVLCEKPLALDGAQSQEMVKAIEESDLPNLVWYNCRFLPAVSLAKEIIDRGELSRVFHYRANFLQDWTISEDLPQGGEGLWHLDAAAAGSGVTGDLLAHNIDTARWLNGEITSVFAMTETFIKERVHQDTGKKQAVTIDDACAFLARFENGSLAIFESTRYARGHKALKTFEIKGEHKSLAWTSTTSTAFPTSTTPSPVKRAAGAASTSPTATNPTSATGGSPALGLGYEHSFVHGALEFFKSLDDPSAKKAFPDFKDALNTQYVCDAVLESAGTKQWADVKHA